MSQFMQQAGAAVKAITEQMEAYGFIYAHARGSGLTPWDASVVCQEQGAEKNLNSHVMQAVRREIDKLIEAREG